MVMCGTICKSCGHRYHNCMSCGNEEYMYDYCSIECLEADGKILCPGCHGWGYKCERVENEDFSCPGYVEK